MSDRTMGGDKPAPLVLLKRFVWPGLAIVSAVVSAAGLTIEILKELRGWSSEEVLVGYLSLSYEANVPNFYQAALLLACATLLSLSAMAARRRGDGFIGRWWILACGFLYMSFDEAAQLHELAGKLMSMKGIFYF